MNEDLIKKIIEAIGSILKLIMGGKEEKVEITKTESKPEATSEDKSIDNGNTDAFADKHGIKLPDKLPD